MLTNSFQIWQNGTRNCRDKRRGRNFLAAGAASLFVLFGAHAKGQDAPVGEDAEHAPPSPVFGIQLSGAFNFALKQSNYSLLALQGNPFQPDPGKPCMFKLDIWEFIGSEEPLQLSLTAQLFKNIKIFRDYSVGRATLNAQPWQDESASIDSFFAKLMLPPDIGQREMNPGTMHVASHIFRSNGGSVEIRTYPDVPDMIGINFRMDLIENVAEKYNPRRLMASGVLAVRLDRSPANALRGFTGALGNSLGEDVQTSSYLCAE